MNLVTLPPMTGVLEGSDWGERLVEPTPEDELIYNTLAAFAAGKPLPAIVASYQVSTPFGTMTRKYDPEAVAIALAIAKVAAAQ